jgi:hypothetical protein
VFFTQITLVEGFVLFPHEKCIETLWKIKNVAPHVLRASKLHEELLRYISCMSLAYNTYRSCTISMHF